MQINIKSCRPEDAEGVSILIDIIHASSTIVQLLESGLPKLIPINGSAKKYKKQGYLVFGERFSTIFKKSEFLNSPYEAQRLDLNGKKAVIKTYNGTRGILAAKNAEELLIGCFLNANALRDYVKSKKLKSLDLIPMGRRGKPAIEDELFADYFVKLLKGNNMNFDSYRNEIIKRSWRNIIRLIFLREHTNYCFRLNSSNIVPIYKNNEILPIRIMS